MTEMTTTKLTINLRDGILDVEGSEEFVREIYGDFKGEVANRKYMEVEKGRQIEAAAMTVDTVEPVTPDATDRKSPAKRAENKTGGQKARGPKFKPMFDPNLDVNGVSEFYNALKPQNAAEQILVFVMFLKEHLKMETCTAHQVYTCFYNVRDRTKIPTAFSQAFYNTVARTHYIQVPSLNEVSATILGGNHFEDMKKRAKSE